MIGRVLRSEDVKRSLGGYNHRTLFMKRKNSVIVYCQLLFKLFKAAHLANLKRMAFLSGSWTTILEDGL